MLNVHPLFVHFPIALLMVALGLEALGFVCKNERIQYAAGWNLALGALGAVAAAVTGLLAESGISAGGAAGQLMLTHKTLALVATGLAVVLAGWRLRSRGAMSSPLRVTFLALMVGMVVVLGVSAHYGGRMVYEFGAGASLKGAAY
ncbi:MAG: DUF2231 domain-containing protein, partial [Armatimonadota bacterium]